MRLGRLVAEPLVHILGRRFVGGKDLNSALRVVKQLNSHGMQAILNFAGENHQLSREIARAAQEYENIASAISENRLRCDVSLKLSQFGLTEPVVFIPLPRKPRGRKPVEEVAFCSAKRLDGYRGRKPVVTGFIEGSSWRNHFLQLAVTLSRLSGYGVRWWLDAELLSTRRNAWTVVSDELKTRSDCNFAGMALQAYGTGEMDSVSFFQNTVVPYVRELPPGKTLGIRLCKGAYRSDPHALCDSREIDLRFGVLGSAILELMSEMVRRGNPPALYAEFATHDQKLLDRVRQAAFDREVYGNRFRLAALYGRRQEYFSHFARFGNAPVAIYVLYGDNLAPYLFRRIRENPRYLLWALCQER